MAIESSSRLRRSRCLFQVGGLCRIKEKLRVNISDGLINYVPNSLAAAPPVLWIIIRIASGDDPHRDTIAEGFLKEKAGSPRMRVFRHHIDTFNPHIVVAKPTPQCNRRTIRSISAVDV